MIDVAIGISWLPVKPDGSNRVPLNFSIRTGSGTPCWSASEIAYSLSDCDTRVLLIDDQFLPMLPQLRAHAPCVSTVIHCGDGPTPDGLSSYESLIASSEPVEEIVRGGEDLAGVFYTGGTTGFPKGVMLPHRALYVNALALQTAYGDMSGMFVLHAAPMFHLADHDFLNTLALAGATHVTVPVFQSQGRGRSHGEGAGDRYAYWCRR